MSFFPLVFASNDECSLSPILRLLNEFDQYPGNVNGPTRSNSGSFTPKFDVKELNSAYELSGELPGIDQNDVELEFVDDSTLKVKGRIENSYDLNARPCGFIEDEVSEDTTTRDIKSTQNNRQESREKEKFWIKERNVGEFSRSFTFPENVNQDQVKASMKNGILSVFVPKAKKQEYRKITIE